MKTLANVKGKANHKKLSVNVNLFTWWWSKWPKHVEKLEQSINVFNLHTNCVGRTHNKQFTHNMALKQSIALGRYCWYERSTIEDNNEPVSPTFPSLQPCPPNPQKSIVILFFHLRLILPSRRFPWRSRKTRMHSLLVLSSCSTHHPAALTALGN
jgi:hypothetical protein